MSWTIERRGRTALVTMNTNPVRRPEPRFLRRPARRFDRLKIEHRQPRGPFAGHRRRFSAGLDLDEHFRLFAGPPNRRQLVRRLTAPPTYLFTSPVHRRCGQRPRLRRRPDHLRRLRPPHRRRQRRRFSLNKVPIGIPMPAVYVRCSPYASSERPPLRTSLFGESFAPQQALELGMFDELVAEDDLSTALPPSPSPVPATASSTTPSPTRHPATALHDIADLAKPLDTKLPHWMTRANARHAHRRYCNTSRHRTRLVTAR